MKLFIFCYTPNVSGITVIIDNLIKQLQESNIEVHLIDKIDGTIVLNSNNLIIPYGIKAAYDLVRMSKNDLPIALLIDAYTLGCKNILLSLLRTRNIFNKLFIKQLISYLIYSYKERYVLRNYEKIGLVSEHDAKYMSKKYDIINKYIIIKNGVDIPKKITKETIDYKSKTIRLGIISYWSDIAFYDAKYFIENEYPFLKKNIDIELIVAGRGATGKMIDYFEQHNVTFLGEVQSLEYFFNQIDIYIVSVIKECGILNKVLDAFAYQKLVIGKRHNFYPFKELDNGYLIYNKKEDLFEKLLQIQKNKIDIPSITNNATRYITQAHDWNNTYTELKKFILKHTS